MANPIAPREEGDYTKDMAKNAKHSSKAPNQRQLRVGELIRRTMSEILQRGEIHDADLNRLSITVGEVRMSPDLRVATAFVLPLGGKDKEEALSLMRKNRYEIRHAVTRALPLKHSPEIRFLIDETFDQMDASRRMFENEDVLRDLDRPEGDDA